MKAKILRIPARDNRAQEKAITAWTDKGWTLVSVFEVNNVVKVVLTKPGRQPKGGVTRPLG